MIKLTRGTKIVRDDPPVNIITCIKARVGLLKFNPIDKNHPC